VYWLQCRATERCASAGVGGNVYWLQWGDVSAQGDPENSGLRFKGAEGEEQRYRAGACKLE
jgi:hypothetical protein